MTGRIDRVVVTLDASSENSAAIDTATQFAARAKTPLHGVFVEDEDLLALADLPVARQIMLGAGVQPYTSEIIELHLRAEAERARRELFAVAKRHLVQCTFEVVRGAPAAALASTSERDLVVAGALSRPIAGYFRLECRWWSSIDAVSGPFLLAQHASSRGGVVVTLLRDRGTAAARLLDTAAQVAEAKEGVLTVICPPDAAISEGFDKWLTDRLGSYPLTVHVEIAPAEAGALHRRIHELGCELLVIEGGMSGGRIRELRDLLEGLFCDLLIVR